MDLEVLAPQQSRISTSTASFSSAAVSARTRAPTTCNIPTLTVGTTFGRVNFMKQHLHTADLTHHTQTQ